MKGFSVDKLHAVFFAKILLAVPVKDDKVLRKIE
jgi:hypothetical protein